MEQKVYREDLVLEALRDLGEEASTDKIGALAGIGSVGALVTCGQLRGRKLAKVEERSRRGNPCWRLIREGDPGWTA